MLRARKHRHQPSRRIQRDEAAVLALVALVVAAVLAGVLGLAVWQVRKAPKPVQAGVDALTEAPAPPGIQTSTDWGGVAAAELGEKQAACDTQGRCGELQVMVLSKEFSLAFAKVDRVQWLGEADQASQQRLSRHLSSQAMQGLYAQLWGLMAVGTASAEGCEQGQQTPGNDPEVRRAAQRAAQLASWLERSAPPKVALYELRLGCYQGMDANFSSADQRRLVVLGLYTRDNEIDWPAAVERWVATMQDQLTHRTPEFPLPAYSYRGGAVGQGRPAR